MQHQIVLPLEAILRLQIALLQRDLAYTQAQLLRVTAEQQQMTQTQSVLAEAHICLPVPLTQCTLDLEHGLLCYEAPDLGEIPSVN
jgi:hypothetical protein